MIERSRYAWVTGPDVSLPHLVRVAEPGMDLWDLVFLKTDHALEELPPNMILSTELQEILNTALKVGNAPVGFIPAKMAWFTSPVNGLPEAHLMARKIAVKDVWIMPGMGQWSLVELAEATDQNPPGMILTTSAIVLMNALCQLKLDTANGKHG